MALAEKTCVPCRGGVPRLSRDEAEAAVRGVPGWTLNEDATRIERAFTFKNFAAAQAFVVKIGAIAEAQDHHPDIAYGWGYCRVTFQTHKIRGLHENDFIMAAKVNGLGST